VSFGVLSVEQREAVRLSVEGRHVVDLGAGALELANVLAALGATRVTAVDQKLRANWIEPLQVEDGTVRSTLTATSARVHPVLADFASFTKPEDATVAFLSWCDNAAKPELIPLLERFSVVCHLSKNSDGQVCGWPALYEYLATRRMTAYLPQRRNTLAIYAGGPVVRAPYAEERAGMSTWWSPVVRYEALEGA
jgi:hypothetical protein